MPSPLSRSAGRLLRSLVAPLAAAAFATFSVPALAAEGPPSTFGPDAPELAPPGRYAVGFETLTLTQHAQADVLAYNAASHGAPKHDRVLAVDVWYPARVAPGAPRVVYSGEFPAEPPAPPARFTVPGVAVRGAPFAGGPYPLVIVSHGYSDAPTAMTWITENLASKGYVVAAIGHDDPPITDAAKFVEPVLRRPLDIAFVASTLQRTLAAKRWIDPQRTALIGYSMGGYGVLTDAGAVLDAHGPLAKAVPGGLLLPYCEGGARQSAVRVAHLRAVVAISPAGGAPWSAWGAQGLGGIRTPLFLINGNRDQTVGYRRAGLWVFEQAIHAPRYLLTLEQAGHDIGLDPAPAEMRGSLWNLAWFQDPVWDAARVNAINAHFITAFLDFYVKGEKAYAAYLDVPVEHAASGVWPNDHAPFAAYSPGTGGITVWKGFQRSFAVGLLLQHADIVSH